MKSIPNLPLSAEYHKNMWAIQLEVLHFSSETARYFADNAITTVQFKGKTLIRRKDVDSLFENGHKYLKRPKKKSEPITEFYTSKEVQEKYGISNSGLYEIAKREKWLKTQQRGKTLWSRKHVDAYFAKQQPSDEISEWYTAAEI